MRKLILPKSPKDLLNPLRQADLMEAFRLGNAFQNLKLSITSGGALSQSSVLINKTGALLTANVNLAQILFDMLLIGGGGGGCVGGGGGGGVVYLTSQIIVPGTYPVVVGAGGAGSLISTSGSKGFNGLDSTALGFTAKGGGGGGNTGVNSMQHGAAGGCGGGGGAWDSGASVGGAGQQGGGGGGNNGITTNPQPGGGGGGALTAGFNATAFDHPGIGGNGIQYKISGSPVYYAGGGGACTFFNGAVFAVGGTGGGGTGGNTGSNGTNGLGGGGGGRSRGNNGWDGGSGVFIYSYPGPARGVGGTITFVGGKTIHTFTSNGTLVIH